MGKSPGLKIGDPLAWVYFSGCFRGGGSPFESRTCPWPQDRGTLCSFRFPNKPTQPAPSAPFFIFRPHLAHGGALGVGEAVRGDHQDPHGRDHAADPEVVPAAAPRAVRVDQGAYEVRAPGRPGLPGYFGKEICFWVNEYNLMLTD